MRPHGYVTTANPNKGVISRLCSNEHGCLAAVWPMYQRRCESNVCCRCCGNFGLRRFRGICTLLTVFFIIANGILGGFVIVTFIIVDRPYVLAIMGDMPASTPPLSISLTRYRRGDEVFHFDVDCKYVFEGCEACASVSAFPFVMVASLIFAVPFLMCKQMQRCTPFGDYNCNKCFLTIVYFLLFSMNLAGLLSWLTQCFLKTKLTLSTGFIFWILFLIMSLLTLCLNSLLSTPIGRQETASDPNFPAYLSRGIPDGIPLQSVMQRAVQEEASHRSKRTATVHSAGLRKPPRDDGSVSSEHRSDDDPHGELRNQAKQRIYKSEDGGSRRVNNVRAFAPSRPVAKVSPRGIRTSPRAPGIASKSIDEIAAAGQDRLVAHPQVTAAGDVVIHGGLTINEGARTNGPEGVDPNSEPSSGELPPDAKGGGPKSPGQRGVSYATKKIGAETVDDAKGFVYVGQDGHIRGPVSIDTLLGWYKGGKVPPTLLVKRVHWNTFVPLPAALWGTENMHD